MDTVDFVHFQQDPAQLLDKVVQDHAPLLVTRVDGPPVVILSIDDYHAYEETAYLMASPRNAARVQEAVAQFEAKQGTSHDLIDE